jgi:putative ABC transport system permease protein
MRQFLTEGVVLATIGGALGLLVGYAGVQLLVATNPDGIPRAAEIALDGRVVLFTAFVAIATGLLFGLAPALYITSRGARSSLRDGGQRTTAGASKQRLRRVLVVAELALAVMLVVGSTLLLRSFAELQRVDPGFEADGLLTFQIAVPAATYPGADGVVGFLERLRGRLDALPGIVSMSVMTGLPPQRDILASDIVLEGSTAALQDVPSNVDFIQNVGRDYFATMQIPLVAGGVFERADEQAAGAGAIVVNERFAERFFPGVDPIGRRMRPPPPDAPWYTIVGVVADVKQAGLDAPTGTAIYYLIPQLAALSSIAPRNLNVVVRTAGDPAGTLPPCRAWCASWIRPCRSRTSRR